MADDERNENEHEDGDEGAKPEGDGLGEAGRKAIAAERKARKAAESELKELRAKVQDIEDKDKSEVERLQGQVKDLTKRAEKAEATVDRYDVAAAKGLTPAQARRLVGSSREELEEDADAMRAELGLDKNDEGEKEQEEQEREDEGLGRPKESLRGGASNPGDETPDAGKLAEELLKTPY